MMSNARPHITIENTIKLEAFYDICSRMRQYNAFVKELKKLKEEFPGKVQDEWKQNAMDSINGLAGQKLRNLVPLEKRRSSGAFFTGSELGSQILKSYKLTFGAKVIFYDPACGASDLLLSVKRHYSCKLAKKQINLQVIGTDIHKEFVEASKLRLSIFDLLNNEYEDYSKNILVANGLRLNNFYKMATHIVTNPPFNLINAPKKLTWASGKVSAAALFVDSILKNVNPGTEVIAVLPDVLRSGSRYEKWRKYISNISEVKGIKIYGQFDSFADVDVFTVLLTKKEVSSEESVSPWGEPDSKLKRISDLAYVSVGTVVDNRDPFEGVERPYIVSRGLEGWTVLNYTKLKRKHKGRAITSPFLAIKRTSRPGDKHRIIATLINIAEPVYVDNHLIVLQPMDGKLSTCNMLMNRLNMNNINDWIDLQIRCRHLTVKVVLNIPL